MQIPIVLQRPRSPGTRLKGPAATGINLGAVIQYYYCWVGQLLALMPQYSCWRQEGQQQQQQKTKP